MTTPKIIGAIVLLAALGIVFPRVFAVVGTSGADSPVRAEPLSHDFGEIRMADGVVTADYALTNDGSAAVAITDIYTSCMCTKATLIDPSGKDRGTFGMPGHSNANSGEPAVRVKPGESLTVRAVFDPAAHGPAGVGTASRSVYIKTTSKTTPELELRLTAVVTN